MLRRGEPVAGEFERGIVPVAEKPVLVVLVVERDHVGTLPRAVELGYSPQESQSVSILDGTEQWRPSVWACVQHVARRADEQCQYRHRRVDVERLDIGVQMPSVRQPAYFERIQVLWVENIRIVTGVNKLQKNASQLRFRGRGLEFLYVAGYFRVLCHFCSFAAPSR